MKTISYTKILASSVLLMGLSACQSPAQRAAEQAAEQAQEQAQIAQVNAEDDSTCRGYGLAYGTAPYAQCRENLANQREADLRAIADAPPPPRITVITPPAPAPVYFPPNDYGSNIGNIILQSQRPPLFTP